MRVIAGTAGGMRLDVPKRHVRPTMDRVKAAIFSSLGDFVIGARVLDLFAGTGALGIEALSRGAKSARFVDQDREAVATIERNLAKTKLEGRVLRREVFAFLRRPISSERFDIIFADPPYEKTDEGEAFTPLLLASNGLITLLKPSGIFVLEKHPSEKMPVTKQWRICRAKRYGATEVLFLNRTELMPRSNRST
jgi:16S rRNA (guanine966-N2)-methyltransferase